MGSGSSRVNPNCTKWMKSVKKISQKMCKQIATELKNNRLQDIKFVDESENKLTLKAFSNQESIGVMLAIFFFKQPQYGEVKNNLEKNTEKTGQNERTLKVYSNIFLDKVNAIVEQGELVDCSLDFQMKTLRQNGNWFTNQQMIKIIIQTLDAVSELHQSDKIHGNISSSSIFKLFDGNYKISNVEYPILQNTTISSSDFCTSYQSPEKIQSNQGSKILLTQKTDSFSIGLIILEVLGLSLSIPFLDCLKKGEFNNLARLSEFSTWINSSFQKKQIFDILQNHCFDPNPTNRIEIYQIKYEIFPFLPYNNEILIENLQEIKSMIKESDNQKAKYLKTQLYNLLTKLKIQVELNQPHSELANTYSSIAKVNLQLNDLEESLKNCKYALKLYIEVSPYGSEQYVLQLQQLSYTYIRKKEYKLAFEQAEKAFQFSKQLLTEPDCTLAHSLLCLAQCYRYIDQPNKGMVFAQKANNMLQQIHGNYPHLDYSLAFDTLGLLYNGQENYEQALQCKEKSLEILEKLFYNQNHHRIAIALKNVGFAHLNLKNFKESIDYYSRSLKILKIIENPNSEIILQTLKELQQIYQITGDSDKSNSIQQEISNLKNNQINQ